jgi:H+/Cl- antiporter ClcA
MNKLKLNKAEIKTKLALIGAFFKHIFVRIFVLIKWMIFSGVSGAVIGLVCIAFYQLMHMAIRFREGHDAIIFGLPFAGLAIVWFYRILNDGNDRGTNLILESISSGEKIPVKMTPLIFVSTIVTHLFGGSAGREGAALQIGGSLGSFFGGILKLEDKDRKIFIMCGMAAAFSALFGTPVAAAVFAIEVISIGTMNYAALVPCAIASLTSNYIAQRFEVAGESFHIFSISGFSVVNAGNAVLLACLCAGVSVIFCILLHKSEQLFRLIKNPYIRIFVGGCIIVALTYLLDTRDYNGVNMNVIWKAVRGEVKGEAFILKMLFTAITLACGYKGGEILPSLFIGATFGSFAGYILGLSPSLCSAIGMVSVFCGVTNCPLTSILLSVEMFGTEGLPYYFISIAISYMLSGYYSLYKTQRIVFSKYSNEIVDRETNH